MVQAFIRCALRFDGFLVGRKPARRHRLGIGKGHDTIDSDARADRGPVERLQKRLRQGETRGLDQDVIGALRQSHQGFDRRDEIVGYSAADAAVRQFDDVLHRAILVCAALEDVPVNANRAELVHKHSEPFALRVGHLCQFYAMGEGFTWETQDKERDIAAARKGWEKAKDLIRDEKNSMVLLDEINIALRYDYLDIAEVVAFLKDEKPPMTHVVLTGRNAKEELIEIADLVTEMTLIKHPFRSGIKGQKGVEF